MIYLEKNVFEAALDRIRFVFDDSDDVIVSISGGKDSTVVMELALIVAREKNRLPLKVFWLDQEVEWQSTVDYVESVMRRPEVQPLWFQVPFKFTNSLSPEKNFISLWDEAAKDKWIHPKSDIAIHDRPIKADRFHPLIDGLTSSVCPSPTAKNFGVLCGMRIDESHMRRTAIVAGRSAPYKGITWFTGYGNKRGRRYYPIYDFSTSDVWAAIAKNNWAYNALYDRQYTFGLSPKDMRCSALIHETAWHNIEMLQEFEPRTYDRFCARVDGISAFSHSFEEGVIPRTLPFMFADWKEYRDYLLLSIVKPEYHEMFRRRWQGQDTEDYYKIHVKECILNDIDGTVNAQFTSSPAHGYGKDGKRYDRRSAHKFS